jgi:SAM-dependent methyltransferase
MDFASFDARNYPTLPAREGYGAWAATYEETVLDEMDLRLLARVRSVDWARAARVADLACGTGRIGVWLKQRGSEDIDGVDLTPEMLDMARAKGVYAGLRVGNMTDSGLEAGAYDLVTEVLADEHISDVAPLYAEAGRLARPGGRFVIVGYHPFFLMNGIPTHFDRAPGEPMAIECYVHLFSEHVSGGLAAGWSLAEMHEGIIDAEWLARKPKWERYANRPVSFAMVWAKTG